MATPEHEQPTRIEYNGNQSEMGYQMGVMSYGSLALVESLRLVVLLA